MAAAGDGADGNGYQCEQLAVAKGEETEEKYDVGNNVVLDDADLMYTLDAVNECDCYYCYCAEMNPSINQTNGDDDGWVAHVDVVVDVVDDGDNGGGGAHLVDDKTDDKDDRSKCLA